MSTETITYLICDRCGSRHNQADYMRGNAWGQVTLEWHGDNGGRTYDGAAAGHNLKGTAWLCMECANAFEYFIHPPKIADKAITP